MINVIDFFNVVNRCYGKKLFFSILTDPIVFARNFGWCTFWLFISNNCVVLFEKNHIRWNFSSNNYGDFLLQHLSDC